MIRDMRIYTGSQRTTGRGRSATAVAVAALLVLAASASPAAAAGRPITTADLLAMQRVGDPQISSDGTRVLYTVSVPDVPANRSVRNV